MDNALTFAEQIRIWREARATREVSVERRDARPETMTWEEWMRYAARQNTDEAKRYR